MELSVVELQNVVKIIDTCAQRGAFEGEELEAVGKVRNKIAEFVEKAIANAQEAESQSDS